MCGEMNGGVYVAERVTLFDGETTAENQAATFRNQDRVWPVRVIRRGDAVRPLPPHARSLADLTFEVGDVRLGVGDYMARRRTAGLLILKHGEIALERYGMGSGPREPLDELLDREVDDRDAGRRRAARWRDRQPGRSLRRSTCRGCAARPMRASPSAMSCGCARAWPGARTRHADGRSEVRRRPAVRTPGPSDSGAIHIGFRTDLAAGVAGGVAEQIWRVSAVGPSTRSSVESPAHGPQTNHRARPVAVA